MNEFDKQQKLRVCLSGASGRVGRLVLQQCAATPDLTIAAGLVSKNSSCLGKPLPMPWQEITFCTLSSEALNDCDVVLDFSSPANLVELAKLCAERKIPLVSGTTGLSSEQQQTLKNCAGHIPLLHSANMSLGALVLKRISAQAREILGDDFAVEILEIHHDQKKDAPSGTALAIAQGISVVTAQSELAINVSRKEKRQANELGIASLRGGDVAGEHRVFFLGAGERLELVHLATDRSIFARGGLQAVRRLVHRPAGLYSIDQLF